MVVIRKFNLQSACYQTVMKATTKIAILITDLGLMLFAACIFFLLNTNAQKNRLKKSGWQNVIVR